ncbi:MAG: cell division protein SepF [Firmicutes bacterium]|nr:cell division protein SepF [Bacillota bacterium]
MGFFDKMKNVIGVEDDYYDDDYTDDYSNDYGRDDKEEVEAQEPAAAPSYSSTYSAASYSSGSTTSRRASNVVSMAATNPKSRINIHEAIEYDDGAKVIQSIAQDKTVVLNLELVEPDKKQRIFDFVNGGLFALDGKIEKVTKDIYILTPKGVQVDKKTKETVEKDSPYQL